MGLCLRMVQLWTVTLVCVCMPVELHLPAASVSRKVARCSSAPAWLLLLFLCTSGQFTHWVMHALVWHACRSLLCSSSCWACGWPLAMQQADVDKVRHIWASCCRAAAVCLICSHWWLLGPRPVVLHVAFDVWCMCVQGRAGLAHFSHPAGFLVCDMFVILLRQASVVSKRQRDQAQQCKGVIC